MIILGIDTILHDVCVAVIKDNKKVMSNVVQKTIMNSERLFELVDLHKDQIGPTIKKAIQKSGVSWSEIDLIAVNNFGSFLSNVAIGVVAAQTLANILVKPLIGVNHQEAHYFSARIGRAKEEFTYPILVLSSSGGHSSFVKINNSTTEFKQLFRIEGMSSKGNKPNFRGIGAAYGYVANRLKISGPIGGAVLLSKYAKEGNARRFNFDEMVKNFDFVNLDFAPLEDIVDKTVSGLERDGSLSRKNVCDVAASFEKSVANLISSGLISLAKKEKAKEINLVGGIAANDVLYRTLQKKCRQNSFVFKRPVAKSLCTDNAAMIASLGFAKYQEMNAGQKLKLKKNLVAINSNLRLEEIALKQRKGKNV